MRIATGMVFDYMRQGIQLNMEGLQKAQNEMATSKRVNQPSDDPAACSNIMSLTSHIDRNQQYVRNIQNGIGWLSQAESGYDSATTLMRNVRTTAVQGANGSLVDEDMKALAKNVDNSIDAMIDIANTALGGSYVFAGSENGKPPFTRVGDNIIYSGDNNPILREVSPGNIVEVNTDGEKLFTGSVDGLVQNTASGLTVVKGKDLQAGAYTVKTAAGAAATAASASLAYEYAKSKKAFDSVALDPTSATDYNASILVDIKDCTYEDADPSNPTGPNKNMKVTLDFSSHEYKTDGSYQYVTKEETFTFPYTDGIGKSAKDTDYLPQVVDPTPVTVEVGNVKLNIDLANTFQASSPHAIGDRGVINVQAATSGNADVVAIKSGNGSNALNFNEGAINNQTSDFKFFTVDEVNGDKYDGSLRSEISTLATSDSAASFNFKGDIFRQLFNLRDRLNLSDNQGVDHILEQLDGGIDWLLAGRVRAGARMNHLQSLQTQLEGQEVNISDVLKNVEGADIAKTSIEFSERQLTYQASMSAGANIMQLSLLQYLK